MRVFPFGPNISAPRAHCVIFRLRSSDSGRGSPMTVDEELAQLEDSLRRLKIEYEIYFNGGAKKAPTDSEWRVQSLLKKLGDGVRLTYPQRFRYNAQAQKYAIFCDLWRQKRKIKEEGYRRPQDALLGIVGLREESVPVKKTAPQLIIEKRVVAAPNAELTQAAKLYEAMTRARERVGLPPMGDLGAFQNFFQRKTEQICQDAGCAAVEYTIEVEGKEVRLTARARK